LSLLKLEILKKSLKMPILSAFEAFLWCGEAVNNHGFVHKFGSIENLNVQLLYLAVAELQSVYEVLKS
jgi:hypothetical protein